MYIIKHGIIWIRRVIWCRMLHLWTSYFSIGFDANWRIENNKILQYTCAWQDWNWGPPGLIYGTQANLAAIGNQTLIECPPQKMDLC